MRRRGRAPRQRDDDRHARVRRRTDGQLHARTTARSPATVCARVPPRGDAIERVALRRAGASGSATVTVVEDFAPVRAAIANRRVARRAVRPRPGCAPRSASTSRCVLRGCSGPGRAAGRRRVRSRCPPQRPPRSKRIARACHRTTERFPPNFLAGDARRVTRAWRSARRESSCAWPCGRPRRPRATRCPCRRHARRATAARGYRRSPIRRSHALQARGRRVAPRGDGPLRPTPRRCSRAATRICAPACCPAHDLWESDMNEPATDTHPAGLALPPYLWQRRWVRVLTIAAGDPHGARARARGLPLAALRQPTARPSTPDIEEHFKYGSTGGEHVSGLPYWIFQALPQVCAEYLPGKGYASLGMIYEDGQDLPIGMSKRHHQGIDKTFLNCAVCHASTVRDAPQREAARLPRHAGEAARHHGVREILLRLRQGFEIRRRVHRAGSAAHGAGAAARISTCSTVTSSIRSPSR